MQHTGQQAQPGAPSIERGFGRLQTLGPNPEQLPKQTLTAHTARQVQRGALPAATAARAHGAGFMLVLPCNHKAEGRDSHRVPPLHPFLEGKGPEEPHRCLQGGRGPRRDPPLPVEGKGPDKIHRSLNVKGSEATAGAGEGYPKELLCAWRAWSAVLGPMVPGSKRDRKSCYCCWLRVMHNPRRGQE